MIAHTSERGRKAAMEEKTEERNDAHEISILQMPYLLPLLLFSQSPLYLRRRMAAYELEVVPANG
jgi:hypothetical protein